MKEERNKTLGWMNQISYYDPSCYTNSILLCLFFGFVDFLPTFGIVRSSHSVYGSCPVQPALPVLDSYRGDLKNKLRNESNKLGEEIPLVAG